MSDAPPTERLAGLTGRRVEPERFADAERHRRRVRRLRIALPLVAAGVVAAVFVSLVVNRRPENHIAGAGTPAIEMTAPVLRGTAENGKPYEVAASEAVQTHDGMVALKDVTGRMELDDGVVTLVAKSGRVAPEAGKAWVTEGVHIKLDDVYTFDTERAEADMKAGIVTGDAKVRVTGPMGTIDAAGFRIEKSVKRVTFTGGVTSVLNPEKFDDGGKDGTK